MAINKKFPNYSKTPIRAKVIKHEAGMNRASRRAEAYRIAHTEEYKRQYEIRESMEKARQARWARVARRVNRAVTRRLERVAAMAAGKSVVYSIA